VKGVINPVRAETRRDPSPAPPPGRADADEITVFESLGLAAEDLAAASFLLPEGPPVSASATAADF